MPLPKEKRDRILITGFVTLILFGVMGKFWILAQMDDWRGTRKKIDAAQQQILKAEQDIADAKQKQQLLEKERETVQRYEKTMPTGDPYAWLLSMLDRESTRRRIEPPDVQSARAILNIKKDDTPGFEVRAFTVKVYADFHKFGELIRDLENEHPLFELSKLSVGAGTPKNPRLQTAVFDVETLILP